MADLLPGNGVKGELVVLNGIVHHINLALIKQAVTVHPAASQFATCQQIGGKPFAERTEDVLQYRA